MSPAAVRTCLVQLGRYGDILNLLPVAHAIAKEEGGKVAMLVHRDFLDLLEGVSYVHAIRWDGDMMQPHQAAKAIAERFERVIVSQVADSSLARQRVCESFNMEQWRYAGFLDRWSDPGLKLVMDNRSRDREGRLLEKMRLRGKPYILVNTRSVSGKFVYEDQLLTEIQMRWGVDFIIVDMRRFRADKLHDLIGLIDKAVCLVTVDTCTLHLAAASRTPVIALLVDTENTPTGPAPNLWYGSKPRGVNLALSMRYREYHHRRNEIDAAIRRIVDERQRVMSGRLELPVTILGVDNFTPARSLQALWFSQKMVQAKDVAIICRPGNQLPGGDLQGVRIKPVIQGSERLDRERFLVTELHKHFETSHCLHVEWDARIANPAAWDPAWLEYDYIGAPWPWPYPQKGFPDCTPQNCVGNLGFALLSKRFCEAVASIAQPTDEEARLSDVYMCRTLRPKLEEMGIRFSPEVVAAQFSCEGRYFCGQFGWHGALTSKINGFPLL